MQSKLPIEFHLDDYILPLKLKSFQFTPIRPQSSYITTQTHKQSNSETQNEHNSHQRPVSAFSNMSWKPKMSIKKITRDRSFYFSLSKKKQKQSNPDLIIMNLPREERSGFKGDKIKQNKNHHQERKKSRSMGPVHQVQTHSTLSREKKEKATPYFAFNLKYILNAKKNSQNQPTMHSNSPCISSISSSFKNTKMQNTLIMKDQEEKKTKVQLKLER